MPKRIPSVTFELLEDNSGVKKWNIEAIHVTITGNRRKYTEDELKLGARSLSYRPININHEDDLWLPHNPFNPDDGTDNRTLALHFVPKEKGVAGQIQIADPEVNDMIRNGEVNRLSIEQKPVDGQECMCNTLEGCFCEQNGVTFTGIALLTSDTRPGDPATKITAESMESIKAKLEKLKAKFKLERKSKIEKVTEDLERLSTLPQPEFVKPSRDKIQKITEVTTGKTIDLHRNALLKLPPGDYAVGHTLVLDDDVNIEGPMKYPCRDCGQMFDSREGLAIHNGMMHKTEADYPWDQCISDQMDKYGDMDTAKQVCGSIKAQYGGGEKWYEQAKKEGITNDMGDCMTEMKDAHPDMPHDQMVAICMKKTGQSSESKECGCQKEKLRILLIQTVAKEAQKLLA